MKKMFFELTSAFSDAEVTKLETENFKTRIIRNLMDYSVEERFRILQEIEYGVLQETEIRKTKIVHETETITQTVQDYKGGKLLLTLTKE